jgi:hypothetical protein
VCIAHPYALHTLAPAAGKPDKSGNGETKRMRSDAADMEKLAEYMCAHAHMVPRIVLTDVVSRQLQTFDAEH